METILEIMHFRVDPDRVGALLAGREEALEALRAEFPGLMAAQLAQVGGDQWVDVVLWESREQAEAAFEKAMSVPGFARWCENVAEAGTCEHATVRHTTAASLACR